MKLFLLVCLGLFSLPLTTQAKDLDEYGAKCKDIGFKPKTPAYGDCVLELRRRDIDSAKATPQNISSNQSKTEKTRTQYEEEATAFFRQQAAEYERRADQDNARRAEEYERQKADYDARVAAIEKEKERQKGLKLLELGLRMSAGQSARDASMATAGMAPLPPTPTNSSAFSPMEQYRITTPSGSLINCRYDPNIRRATCY